MRSARSFSPRSAPGNGEDETTTRGSGLLRYGGVVASVVIATLLRVPLHPVLGSKAAFVTLFPAIVYSAWVAGFGGGLVATGLCAFVAAWFIMPPAASLRVTDPHDLCSLLVFVLVGIAISALGLTQHRAQHRAEDSARRAAESASFAQDSASVLQDSEARKAAILEAALDCIITIDDQGRVLDWNPAAEQTFGYARAAALGQTLSELIVPPPLRAAHNQGIAHFLSTGSGPVLNRRIEVPALHAEGREFPVELTVVPIQSGGRTMFTAYLRDLTERERSAAQQRTFLRDVLLSVTEGHLHLCHAPGDLPVPLPLYGKPVKLSITGGIGELRGLAKEAAAVYSFAPERQYDLMTATSEAAMNAAVHAGGGQGRICGGAETLQVWVEDQGQGIDVAHLPRAALEKGYSSAGTLGHGMKMMLQTADRVYLLTGASGTTVVVEQDRLCASPPP